MGAATVFIMVSALAPGNVAVTMMVGGVILGYCSIGNCREAANPARTIMIDKTDAKIGRVIKNFAMFAIVIRWPKRNWPVKAVNCGRASMAQQFYRVLI